jgi:hypothetical protein
VLLVKVTNKETQTVVSALIKQAKKLPTESYEFLTWDRGKELAAHRRFTLATKFYGQKIYLSAMDAMDMFRSMPRKCRNIRPYFEGRLCECETILRCAPG